MFDFFKRKQHNIEIWQPVFSDDVYIDPLPAEPIFSDDFPEPKETYSLTYENLEYPDFDGFLPDSQPLCEDLDISTAFEVMAELSARAWLKDGGLSYETDPGYTINPRFED